ncbi:MAG: hypothetical protein WB988_17170, partial [Candidatus Nitrosopolaris sp.]
QKGSKATSYKLKNSLRLKDAYRCDHGKEGIKTERKRGAFVKCNYHFRYHIQEYQYSEEHPEYDKRGILCAKRPKGWNCLSPSCKRD